MVGDSDGAPTKRCFLQCQEGYFISCSVITANTESDFTRNLYIGSLQESLASTREQFASVTMCTTVPHRPSRFSKPNSWNNTQMRNSLQHSPGGGGGGKGKGGGGDNGDWHQTPWKEKNFA
jgi:hypothetical protein